MKKIFTSLFMLCGLIAVKAQIPALQWAKNIGGPKGRCVRADAAGNVYTTGSFGATADFDPGPGTFNLTAIGGAGYVSKLDAAGNFVWAVSMESADQMNTPVSVLPDAEGNVYVVGYFTGTVDFDPGPATFNITTNGQYDIGIVKLDGNGNFIWAKTFGNTQGDFGYAATLDPLGNICVTGVFMGIVDFDPGPGVFNLTGGSGVFNRCFILKLDASGNFVQAQRIVATYSEGDAVTFDAAGNLYLCGNYTGTADLDPGTTVFNVTATSGADAFVVKLDNTGSFVWGKSFGGLGTDNAKTIKVDAAGNIYIGGDFNFTVDFDPGPAVFNITPSGTLDGFILKLDINGNFIWAKILGGPDADAIRDIALDASANIYITGLFQTTADFDPGPGVFNLTATSNDIFISKLTSDGNFEWAIGYGGFTLDEGLSVFCNATGNVYATGYFKEIVDFDPGPGTTFLNSFEGPTFIVKLGAGVLPLTLLNFTGTNTAAGNVLLWKTTQEINTKHFEIEWSIDGTNFAKIATQQAAGNSSSVLQYNYLHTDPASGNNYYRLKMVDIDGSFNYSPIVTIRVTHTASKLLVYPNPVASSATVSFTALENGFYEIRVTNQHGQTLSQQQVISKKGNNSLSIYTGRLAAGNYQLLFIEKATGVVITSSFIKQ